MYRIGIDLGGTNIAVGLVDENMTLIKKKSTPTLADRAGEEIVADMARLCREICEEQGITMDDIKAIGIASPGVANLETGVVEYANNLHFVKFPLAEILGNMLNFKNIKIIQIHFIYDTIVVYMNIAPTNHFL